MKNEPRDSTNPSHAMRPPGEWKPRLRRWEASLYLRSVHGLDVAPATLAKYATTGGGPVFNSARAPNAKRGIPLYPTDELDAWALARLGRPRRSTSDKDAGSES